MSELVCEFDRDMNIGRKVSVANGLFKRKYIVDNHTYILYDCKDVMYIDIDTETLLIDSISKSIKKFICNAKSILVVGLGNRHISADSLGTSTLKRVIATRGLVDTKVSVSAISTSVFGLTGIESADIINSVKQVVKPDVVILIDSLCAENYKNLVNHFQISDAGFSPGAGIGNNRKVVDATSIKCKTITIGVPLVVYAKTFVKSAINNAMQTTMQYNKKQENIGFCNQLLKEEFDCMVLTIKDIDLYIKKLGFIISSAINKACNNYDLLEQKMILGE